MSRQKIADNDGPGSELRWWWDGGGRGSLPRTPSSNAGSRPAIPSSYPGREDLVYIETY